MSNGDDIMDPGDTARIAELTALLPGLEDPGDRIAVESEINSIQEKYGPGKFAGGGEVTDEYAGGGYVPRGTIAGEIDRRGDMSVREEGETMYELAKRRGDERTYMANGGEVDMSRRARRMYATGGSIDILEEEWDELDEEEQEAIIESISDVLPGGKDGGEVKKKRKKKKKKKKKSVSVKSSFVDGVGAGKSRGGGAAIRGLIFRGIF